MKELQNILLAEKVDTDTESLAVPELDRGYTSTSGSILLITITFSTGVLYVILQWFRQNSVQDSIFVSMLIAATMILVFGIVKLNKYIIKKGLNFCVFLLSQSNSDKVYKHYDNLCKSVINYRRMTIAGLVYGIAIGTAPFILEVWNSDLVLKIVLSFFMFSVNFVTGIAFYGLITFFSHSIKMGSMVNVNLWQLNNPSTDFFLGATRHIAVLASIYVSLCLTSILFSLLPVGGFIIAYSIFAASMIIASLIIPLLPVVRKLKDAKNTALFEIDKQLHLSFYKYLDETKSTKSDVDFEKVKTLLELREKVEGINIWPFHMKFIMAGISVFFFSSVPIILQVILKKLIE